MTRARIAISTAYWLQRAYERARIAYAKETGKPIPKRRRKAKPAPGTREDEPENG